MLSKIKFDSLAPFALVICLILGVAFVFFSQNGSDGAQPDSSRPDSQPVQTDPVPDHHVQVDNGEEPETQPSPPSEVTPPDESTQVDVEDSGISRDDDNPLPANWDELTPEQKIDRNPFKLRYGNPDYLR